MTTSQLYRGARYPREIISHVVWLYFRFSLSFRDIEELITSRGVIVTYETIRQWTLKFGQRYANQLRRRTPQRGDKWHLDEVMLTIKGEHHYLWRAVDQDGHTLDVSCRVGVTGRRPNGSFASCSRACVMRHGS